MVSRLEPLLTRLPSRLWSRRKTRALRQFLRRFSAPETRPLFDSDRSLIYDLLYQDMQRLRDTLGVDVARWGFGYTGDLEGPGFEYGSAFILTAGLMNLLLILDALDIARDIKS